MSPLYLPYISPISPLYRDFKAGAALLLDSVATFTATERLS